MTNKNYIILLSSFMACLGMAMDPFDRKDEEALELVREIGLLSNVVEEVKGDIAALRANNKLNVDVLAAQIEKRLNDRAQGDFLRKFKVTYCKAYSFLQAYTIHTGPIVAYAANKQSTEIAVVQKKNEVEKKSILSLWIEIPPFSRWKDNDWTEGRLAAYRKKVTAIVISGEDAWAKGKIGEFDRSIIEMRYVEDDTGEHLELAFSNQNSCNGRHRGCLHALRNLLKEESNISSAWDDVGAERAFDVNQEGIIVFPSPTIAEIAAHLIKEDEKEIKKSQNYH